jgi:hypothetical protein
MLIERLEQDGMVIFIHDGREFNAGFAYDIWKGQGAFDYVEGLPTLEECRAAAIVAAKRRAIIIEEDMRQFKRMGFTGDLVADMKKFDKQAN